MYLIICKINDLYFYHAPKLFIQPLYLPNILNWIILLQSNFFLYHFSLGIQRYYLFQCLVTLCRVKNMLLHKFLSLPWLTFYFQLDWPTRFSILYHLEFSPDTLAVLRGAMISPAQNFCYMLQEMHKLLILIKLAFLWKRTWNLNFNIPFP